jgi:hypothetical protein
MHLCLLDLDFNIFGVEDRFQEENGLNQEDDCQEHTDESHDVNVCSKYLPGCYCPYFYCQGTHKSSEIVFNTVICFLTS